jgi:hypothetical protein
MEHIIQGISRSLFLRSAWTWISQFPLSEVDDNWPCGTCAPSIIWQLLFITTNYVVGPWVCDSLWHILACKKHWHKRRKKTKSALEPPSFLTLPFGFLKTNLFSFFQFAEQFFFCWGLESATCKLVTRRGLWQGCHGNLEALYVALWCVSVRHPHGSTTRFV